MAFEQLFVRTKKSIGGVELDAVLSETHSNQIRLTKNPIELGADITDHAIIEPKKLSIVAQVSDTPLGTAAFAQIVDLVTGLFGTSTSENITRSNAAYNAMVQLMELREPIEIQTKLKLYTDMIITNITTTQDKNSSRIVLMSITIEEVIIVESQIVQLEPDQLEEGSPTEQGSSADKKGRQETTTPTDTTSKSVLKSVSDWIRG
tara:strand:- start:4850 stop:5464 length:615 start_codon:yes stop_codon:yes gene_type:complete